mmetsp:Transcript_78136/g.221000  ORF Transcript_78136/g.221000 Transcript_78136/m.221000 type:complete len:218 (+) Transcript_78136:367-1020(+)
MSLLASLAQTPRGAEKGALLLLPALLLPWLAEVAEIARRATLAAALADKHAGLARPPVVAGGANARELRGSQLGFSLGQGRRRRGRAAGGGLPGVAGSRQGRAAASSCCISEPLHQLRTRPVGPALGVGAWEGIVLLGTRLRAARCPRAHPPHLVELLKGRRPRLGTSQEGVLHVERGCLKGHGFQGLGGEAGCSSNGNGGHRGKRPAILWVGSAWA